MSSILTQMVAAAMVKQAYTTYSYTASMSRNYTPSAPDRPSISKSSGGEKAYNVTQHPVNPLGIAWGKNRNATDSDTKLLTGRGRLHTFSPTISGTGSGRQYWDYDTDPYR